MEPQDQDAPGFYTPVGTRRKFFQWVTEAAAGLIGLSLTIPLVGYVISPALKRRDKPWVEIGGMDELAAGEPKQLDYVATIRDGYWEAKTHKAVWAVKQSDGQVTVFSPMCTHLGCGYHWDTMDRRFKCPCHGSVYDVSGRVLAGPAPRHLDALPFKIEQGRLLVMYKEFKSGFTEQIEL
ncbi:MAG TPA: ubiquinol-cytochrome c reductase iron-sulfur subunit [Nitrospira sp.]|nr:ubiquinol-cytochrome c reductase iron-sulfur subunit [Nitrospira sp.]